MPFSAVGDRVEVRPPTLADVDAYREAVTRSHHRLADFAVPDPENLPAIVASQSAVYRSFMVWARDPGREHGLVGRVNVANVVRGSFRSATMGYDAYDPYAGTGLFAEGLRLVVGLLFAPEPEGMGLHRVEANIQPVNGRSAGLARSLGFVNEGFSRDYLHIPGPDGRRDWRDHDRYTMLATDWPAEPYRPHPRRRTAVLVSGLPGAGKSTLATALAAELGLPLLSRDAVKEGVAGPLAPDVVAAHGTGPGSLGEGAAETLWRLLADSPVGAVVESHWRAGDADHVRRGLAAAGFDPASVPEVHCDLSPVDTAGPLGLGPVVTVDTREPLTPRQLVAVALRARVASSSP